MSIAPLAALGIAQTAFSLIGALADVVKRPQEQVQSTASSVQPRTQESIWHQVGQSANVRALTREELTAVAQQLYADGAISLQDQAALSGDPSFAGTSGLLTAADAAGRVDWVAEYQARLNKDSTTGDTQAAAQDRRVLDILSRLQAGSRGATSIMV